MNLFIVLPVLFDFWFAGTPSTGPKGVLQLPPRPACAMTGTEFYNYIVTIPDTNQAAREQAIINEFASGNVPDFLRTLKPITVSITGHTATYYVTPDYVAIGSNEDFFRIPMSAPLAQQVADYANCNLPTRKMVIDVHNNAQVKITPSPFSPATYDIDSVPVFWMSNQAIETKRKNVNPTLGLILDGAKKDVIISITTPTRPSPLRVCIMGWYNNSTSTDNTYIQPLSTVHENTYEDYSHGIRLVEHVMLVDGQPRTVDEVLVNATLTALLNDETASGSYTLTTTRYPIPSPYVVTPSTVCLGPDLVNDGNFEGTYTAGVAAGWTSFTVAGSAAITFGRASINHVDGSYAQYFNRADTLAIDGGIYQVVTVEAGKSYQLTVNMKRQSSFTGSFLRYGADLTGGTNPTAGTVTYKDITGATDDTWINDKTTFTATGTTMTIFLRAGHAGTTGDTDAYNYFDAVSLKKTN